MRPWNKGPQNRQFCLNTIDIWGVTPLGGGPSTDRGSKNGDISTRFRRRRRRKRVFCGTEGAAKNF